MRPRLEDRVVLRLQHGTVPLAVPVPSFCGWLSLSLMSSKRAIVRPLHWEVDERKLGDFAMERG